MIQDVFITSMGAFLPNGPIGNEEMEEYLGKINGIPSRLRSTILKKNGIVNRYYAMTKDQQSTHSNAQMAVLAAKAAISNSDLTEDDIQLIATGTTQGDLPVPGFASMVHAGLAVPNCEVASFQSVCTSGMMALNDAFVKIKSGVRDNALTVGSDFASRLFKSTRFEAQHMESVPFETEFLRWLLSDGAGAFVLQNRTGARGLSLRIDWIDIISHANQFPLCMYAGRNDGRDESEPTWLDYPDFSAAAKAGALNLKQDLRLLDQVVQVGVAHFFNLIDRGMVNVSSVDWLCCHYSSEFFRTPIMDLMRKGGAEIPEHKWFSNLPAKGNTGAASIYIMLEELFYSGSLKPGQTILCMVPESGRFITSFMKLTVVAPEKTTHHSVARYPLRNVEAPGLIVDPSPVSEWLVRELTRIWIGFETALLQVPFVSKIHEGKLTRDDYKLLLHDLRQQVIDGSQWISRAASNIDIDLFELRSAFIRHTAAEHKDYQMLEKNFEAMGEDIGKIRRGEKNIGTLALSNFMFQQASRNNPIDLLGAMFIIEGIGKRLAGYWGEMMKDQLGLRDDQVSFFTYHGVADENHFHNLEQALNHPALDMDVARRIAKTARTTAKLYQLQLEELGNY